MENKYLTIPNTKVNQTKVSQAVAEYMVKKCLTKSEIMELAIARLMWTHHEAKHTIGDLASMVNETKAYPDAREPQPEHALYFGSFDNEYYFFTRERSPEYNSLEVKEEVR